MKTEVADSQFITSIGVPLLIVVNKYDLFRDQEPLVKKNVSFILRLLAHMHGASLVYASSRDRNVKDNFRNLMSNALFQVPLRKPTEKANDMPLLVPFGSDSLEQVSVRRTFI